MYVYGSPLLVLFSRIETESLLDLQMLLNRGRYLKLATSFSTKWRSHAPRAPDSVAVMPRWLLLHEYGEFSV